MARDSAVQVLLYSQRLGTVEPLYGNLESNEGLTLETVQSERTVVALLHGA